MGCSWGGTRPDARPSYFNLFTEPRNHPPLDCYPHFDTDHPPYENIAIGPGAWAGIQYAVGEQQSKRTQSGEQ